MICETLFGHLKEKKGFRLYASINDMGSRGRPLFDLNEPPSEEEMDELVAVSPCVLQKSLPTLNPRASNLLPSLEECPRIFNNNAFTHAASGSGFQPFFRIKEQHRESAKRREDDSVVTSQGPAAAAAATAASRCEDEKVVEVVVTKEVQPVEKEEGEWSDMEGNADVSSGSKEDEKAFENGNGSDVAMLDMNNDSLIPSTSNDGAGDCTKDAKGSDDSFKGDTPADVLEEPSGAVKRKEVRGIEATHALRLANHNPAKKAKYDEEKEQKLGKLGKTRPKTILVGMEDVKNNCSMKNTPQRRQSSFAATTTTTTRIAVKEISRSSSVIERTVEKPSQGGIKDQKQQSEARSEVSSNVEFSEHKTEPNGDVIPGPQTRSKKISNCESSQEVHLTPTPNSRPSSWKLPVDSRQFKASTASSKKQSVSALEIADAKLGNKRPLPSKKQSFNNQQYHDTSVERLLREVTNEQFWHHPGLG